MAKDPPRLRIFALLGLWAPWTRSVLSDGSRTSWGVALALWGTLFFLYVGRSQVKWLGRSHGEWWGVACRADVAAFVAMISPQRWMLPLCAFLLAFRMLGRFPKLVDGGALWRGAPLLLLLHPRQWYALDVIGVAILVGARHREPGDILELKDFHREHEYFVASDVLGCCVLASAGAPLPTRAALAMGAVALCLAAHLKFPRERIGYWDAANKRAKPHMPIPFRGVNAN